MVRACGAFGSVVRLISRSFTGADPKEGGSVRPRAHALCCQLATPARGSIENCFSIAPVQFGLIEARVGVLFCWEPKRRRRISLKRIQPEHY
jgi:hypothetical protein